MGKYARGKKSYAISDISGLRVKYTKLKTTWDGLRVSPEDYEPKHPQLTPAKNVVDATALFNGRPDNDPENVVVYIGFTQDWTIDPRARPPVGVPSIGEAGYADIHNDRIFSISGVSGAANVGTAIASDNEDVPVSGTAGTGAIGSENFELEVTDESVSGTGAVGTEVPELEINETGVGGTGATGTPELFITVDATVSGTSGTGSVGTEVLELELAETGVSGTGAIGSETFETEIGEAGVGGTGAIGSEVPELELGQSGVSGDGESEGFGVSGNGNIQLLVTGISGIGSTGAVGEEVSASEAIETGVGGTGALGSANVEVSLAWGEGTWGSGTWGN
jgi:hypothetical protein